MGFNLYMTKAASIVSYWVLCSTGLQWSTICTYFIYSTSITSNQARGKRDLCSMNAVHYSAVSGKPNQGSGGWFWLLTCFGIFCLQSAHRGREEFATRSNSRPVSLLKLMHDRIFLTSCFKCSPELFDLVLQTLFTLLLIPALTVEFITGCFIWVSAEHTHGFESMQRIDK